jgi:hypothetical protein
VKEICSLVGDLPLALCLAGNYLAQSEEKAEEFLTWLKTESLESLDHGDSRDRSITLLLERSLSGVSDLARQIVAVYSYLAYSLAAPEAVAAGRERPVQELKPALNELLNFDLVCRQKDRYRLSHPLIHYFARQRPVASNEVLSRLAAYYLNLSEEAIEKHELFSLLDAERPHIINILSICQDHQEWQAIIPLVWSIDMYLDLGGYYTEWVKVLNFGLYAARHLGDRQKERSFWATWGMPSFSWDNLNWQSSTLSGH